jgi:hypothetical protein
MKRGRRVGHAHLGLPVLGHQAQRGSSDQQQEGDHDDQRGQAHAVGCLKRRQAACQTPSLFWRRRRRLTAVFSQDCAHFSTTRGSATL